MAVFNDPAVRPIGDQVGSPVSGLVSVIIPTYNRSVSVLDAIESVRSQTYPSREIIIVDDGSTDDTAQRVSGITDVRYTLQARGGPAAARTRGLRLARGEFIASLDSDDLWGARFLERSVAAITADGLDFVFSNWTLDTGKPSYFSRRQASGRLAPFCTERHGEWWVLTPAQLRHMFLDCCLAPSSSLLLRRSSMPSQWNDEMRVADDWYLILAMVLPRACRAAFTTQTLWLKRADGTNRYDGRSFNAVVRQLYFHDHFYFRRDFRRCLSRRERSRLALRQTGYLAVLDSLRPLLERLPRHTELAVRRRLGR